MDVAMQAAMNWQIAPLSDTVPTLWKNGGGTTRELIAWPNATDWVWRMSVAEVASSGAFSMFDGVQRWFSVLSGAGVELTMGDAPEKEAHLLTVKSEAFSFDGLLPVDCQLIDGITQDFNLMVRRDKAQGQMKRIAGSHQFTVSSSSIVAIYSVDEDSRLLEGKSSHKIPAHCLVWKMMPTTQVLSIDTPDALWMEIKL